MTTKPPLGLQVELVFADGTTKRFDSEAKDAADQPTSISLKTARYTGFTEGQATLNRRIDLEYPDLGLLDGFNLIGYDGSVAYEGVLGSLPKSLEGSPKVMLQAQGWMSHATRQKFVEVYVDRDLSKWGSPSNSRTVQAITENFVLGSLSQANDEAGNSMVALSLPSPWASPFKPLAEAWWPPAAGISLGALYYSFPEWNSTLMSGAEWRVFAYLAADDGGAVKNGTANLAPPTASGYLTPTSTAKTAMIQLWYNKTAEGASGQSFYARFEKLAVYGTHGLTRQGEDPGGFYVSDMIKNIASRWAPKLDTSGVEGTTLPIPHASFLEETLPYDAFQTLNQYHRWEMDVYEGRRLNYYPIDLTDWDWEIRLSDPGVTSSLQGDNLENLCNGVIVRYRSLTTGYEERLTPSSHEQLRDESPDNPANLHGEPLYTTLTLSVPTSEEVALEVGRIYLGEFNEAKSPGSITVKGHVRDRAGHWQQGWKVRSSGRLKITDLPNDSVRVAGETAWDHDSKTLTIAVDSSFKRLDAILARLGVAVEASGLNLP